MREKLKKYAYLIEKKFNHIPSYYNIKKQALVLYYSMSAFRSNQVPIRAAALTYTTFLALIPFIIILFAVAGQFGYLDLLLQVIPQIAADFNVELPLEQIDELIGNAQSVKLSGLGIVGSVFLFISFLLAMSNLEKAMNIIWEIEKNRSWLRRLQVYTPFLLFLIAFILILAWMLVKLKIYINELSQIAMGYNINPQFQLWGVILSIVGLAWLFICVLYYLIPYTEVNIKSSILGATTTIILQGLLIYAFINLQTLLFKNYSMLYGSLAIFPLLMVFIYLNWIIILNGVTYTFSHQKNSTA